MATWAIDTVSCFEGPEWAAPESAFRHRHTTVARPATDPVWPILVDMLGKGRINPYQFQTAMRLKLESERETRDWTEEDWVAWETTNPE